MVFRISAIATYSLFSILFLSMGSAYAEYFVYKNSPDGRQPLIFDEYKAVYKILMRYQFPMSSNHFDLTVYTKEELTERTKPLQESAFARYTKKEAINLMVTIGQNIGPLSRLSEDEINRLKGGEEQFIRAEIKKLNPALDIDFIPTSLFELVTLNYFAALMRNQEERFGILKKNIDTLLEFSRLCSLYGYRRTLEQTYLYKNYIPEVIRAAFDVNNRILNTINLTNLASAFNELTPLLFSKELYELDMVRLYSKMDSNEFEKEVKAVLHKAVQLEYEAHENNKALIWRGTTAYEKPIFEKSVYTADEIKAGIPQQKKQDFIDATLSLSLEWEYVKGDYYSNSYGNTLFAGWQDAGKFGAMAFSYIMRKGVIGYALLIDKISYSNPESALQKLFFIPPTSTIVGSLSTGELFHARSRVALCNELVPPIVGVFEPGIKGFFLHPRTTGNFLAFVGNPAEHETAFSQYLVDNLRILRNASEKVTGTKDANGNPIKVPLTEQELKSNQLKTPAQKFPTQRKLLFCSE